MRMVDVAVIGAGPAGATLATICARNGLDVALYEREPGARYRVGESLLPATPRYVAPLLGVETRIAHANFVVKPGATFCWGRSPDRPWNLLFGGPDAGPGAPTALNVERECFDAILLDNAAARGVEVLRGHTVVSVEDGDSVGGREVEVRASTGGACHRVRARYVANASGQVRLKVPKLDARTHSRFFRKVAVWGYWDGGARLDPPLQGNVLFETLATEHGPAWAWFIPLSRGRTSVGVVAPRACAGALSRDRRAKLRAWLSQCPRTVGLLAEARASTEPPYDVVRVRADYSYASDAFWAPGLVQVGDAACFVDVLLSSGVHLATYGALLAARSIEAVLSGQLPEMLAMNEYESRLRQEFAIFYAGLNGLYDMTRSRDDYIEPLRNLLRSSNGVLMEWDQSPDAAGGLNRERAVAARDDPGLEAASNQRVMSAFNLAQLLDDGRPRGVPVTELPAVRNTLTASPDGRGWRLPWS